MLSTAGDEAPNGADARFARKVLIVLGLLGLSAVVVYLSNLLLLIVGAVIVAVLLRAAARVLARIIPIGEDWAVLPASVLIAAALVAGIWLFGRQMADQVAILVASVPEGWSQLKSWLAGMPFGDVVSGQLEHIGGFAIGFADQVPLIAMGVAGALANTGLALVGGVMLAVEPRAYRDGLLLLIPRGPRPSVRRALNASGVALQGWLTAQFISMTIIGLLTGIGLWLIGLPSALGLGLFAGVAQFVPVIGPIASAVPGALVAATQSGEMLIWTLGIYLAVQQIEGNLVTPWVQKRYAGIPMALALFAIVAFGALFGPLGVILATPLTLIVLVLVRSLYIRDVLGEDVDLPGEQPMAKAAARRAADKETLAD